MIDPQRNFKDLGEGTLRRIDWQELLPGTLLFRAFYAAFGVRVLLLSLAGVVGTLTLASVLTLVFGGAFEFRAPEVATLAAPCDWSDDNIFLNVTTPLCLFIDAGYRFWEPQPFTQYAHTATWFFGLAVLWGVCGGAVFRITAVRLGRGGNEPLRHVAAFGFRRLKSFYGAMLLLVVAMMCCYIPLRILHAALGTSVFHFIAACGFGMAIPFAIVAVLLAFLLSAGANLLLAAVVVDGADMFDAVSRAASYLYQRFFHYALYLACAAVLGTIGMMLTSLLTSGATEVMLRYTGSEFATMVRSGELMTLFWSGRLTEWSLAMQIASFWVATFQLLPHAFGFSFFGTASVAIYLLLRRSLDGTPLDHVVSHIQSEHPLPLVPRRPLETE